MAEEKCCCFELRTGGLIIIWLNLIGSVLAIFAEEYTAFIPLLIAILGIYAIVKNERAFLWPQMILQTIYVVYISFGVIITFSVAFIVENVDIPNGIDPQIKAVIQAFKGSFLLVFLLLVAIFALNCYLLKVLILCYQQMKDDIPAYTRTTIVGNMEQGYAPQYVPQAEQQPAGGWTFKP